MKKAILIVEDDLDIRQSLADVLEDEGYPVLLAQNGEDGLKVLKEVSNQPGLVILDMMMPVMDGFGFRDAQIKDPAMADIPTAIFSADGKLPEKAMKTGIKEFIRKPFNLNQLFDLAEKYCH